MTIGIVQRDAATAEFFDATARGELLIRQCVDCARFNAPQNSTCAACRGDDLTWTVAAGTGVIASWSVMHGRPRDGGPAPRTVVAIVELDEGPWLHAQIVDADPDTVRTGAQVTVEFERPEGGEAVPVFRPRPAEPS